MNHRREQRRTQNARVEAARQLDENENRQAFVGLSRHNSGTNAQLERNVRDLVSGVTRWRRYLDFIIASFYSGEFAAMEQSMQTVLRLGLYELLFTRKPDHAVLNEAVETTKIHVRPGAAGLANGLLRSILRKKEALPEPTGAPAEKLAIRYSHPTWMVERWLQKWGEEPTRRFLEHNNERPVFGVHIQADRAEVLSALHEAEVSYTASRYLPEYIRTSSVQPLLRGGFLKRGSVRIQDEAAALVVAAMDIKEGESVLDVCSAPGGKTVLSAVAVGLTGRVVAADIHGRRLRLVRQNVALSGLRNVTVEKADGTQPPPNWKEAFDHVLLDAPCTGFGVLAKRADMRWKREESEMPELISLQHSLLDESAGSVKPGGLLLYSTCTLEEEENEQQVASFLERHPDFSLEKLPSSFPDALITKENMYQSLPFDTEMDGAFACRLRRNA